MFGGTRYARYQEGQRRAAERSNRKVAELQKQRKERRWRHEQFISAVDQRMKEIEQDLHALAQGKAVARDPTTYN